jgi:dipeptidyl aminopeptidase/acylaminoacyl peptidase
MALDTGHRLGPYEIVAAIGAGGMGEVYRARDTRLGRDVAIKVLPPVFALDTDRRARFDREAQTVAALSHPHIVAVFDTGVDGSTGSGHDQLFVVMELLEGETLRERLENGALPLRKAIEYGAQIARGLAAAHDKGLVHRDLKPENIFILADGHVKILDFGLARTASDPSGSGVSETVAALTDPGQVMGTMGYMAPEQVRGRQVDGRADLFAFGAVLYEMVTGQRAFQRDTPADTMTAILKEEPPELQTVRADLPPALDRIVRHCLEKNPAERFHSARDVAFALESLSGTATTVSGSGAIAPSLAEPRRRATGRERLAWALAAVGIAAAALTVWRWPVVPAAPVARFKLPVDAATTTLNLNLAVAPDGHAVVIQTAWASRDRRLHLRRLDTTDVQPLPGTEGGTTPFWSPDSASIGFVAGGVLKRFDIATSSVRPIASVNDQVVVGLSAWGSDGTIIVPVLNSSLRVVRAGSNTVTELSPLDAAAGELGQTRPVFAPGGRLIYRSRRNVDPSPTLVRSLESPQTSVLTTDDLNVIWAGETNVVFRRGESLYAQPVDWSRPALTGEPTLLTSDLDTNTGSAARESVSNTGVVAFLQQSDRQQQFTWYDRAGKALGPLGPPGSYAVFDLSNDGRRIATGVRAGSAVNLWAIDAASGSMTRVTLGSSNDVDPRWSPDGLTLIFGSLRDPSRSPHRVRLTADAPVRLFAFPGRIFALDDWSRDGRWLLYHDARVPELYAHEVDPTHTPIGKPVLAARALTGIIDQGQFSPDSKWIAYNSDETGTTEVYVAPFPATGERFPISRGGGAQPTWRADGKELYFLALDGMLKASTITVNGSSLTAADPVDLFRPRLAGVSTAIEQYAPHPDGKRFVVVDTVGGDRNLSIGVLLNWPSLSSISIR